MGACHKPFPHLQRENQLLIQTRPGSQHPALRRRPRPGDSWGGVRTSKQRRLWTAWTHVEWRWWSAHAVQMWIVNEGKKKNKSEPVTPTTGKTSDLCYQLQPEPLLWTRHRHSLSFQAEPVTMALLTVACPLWQSWGVSYGTLLVAVAVRLG